MLKKRQPIKNILRVLDNMGKNEDVFSSLMDDLFHFHGFSHFQGITNPDFSPALDFVNKGDKYLVTVEVPGLEKNEFQIEIDEDMLILKGEKKSENKEETDEKYVCERCYGSFRREMRLPSDSDFDKIDATYQDGILKIDIAKIKTKEKEKKKITIK